MSGHRSPNGRNSIKYPLCPERSKPDIIIESVLAALNMGNPQPNRMYTIEEYLEFEERAEEKHEYIAGRIYPLETAMAGGEKAHAHLTINLGALMHSRLPKGCIGLSSDMKIRIEELNINTYADLTIVSGEPQFVPASERQETFVAESESYF